MSLPPIESIPTDDDDQRIGLTALGRVAAHGGAPEQRATFFVVEPGNAFVTLRGAGDEAWALLQRLRRGSRVALVELAAVEGVVVDVAAERPVTEAGRRAGWGGEDGFFSLAFEDE